MSMQARQSTSNAAAQAAAAAQAVDEDEENTTSYVPLSKLEVREDSRSFDCCEI
jgi:hypothetical protein